MMQRITDEMLELAGTGEAMVGHTTTYEDDMKALIHLEHEQENASKKNYEKTISSMSAADRAEARKIVEKLLKQAQTNHQKSDGADVNNCVEAVFNAYFEDGSDGFAKALKMLEE